MGAEAHRATSLKKASKVLPRPLPHADDARPTQLDANAESLVVVLGVTPTPSPKEQRVVSMPERVGPHVKLVFAEMARQLLTYDDVSVSKEYGGADE
jgi:hypothetical protein